MQHSTRIEWAERAYGLLRQELLPEAPELVAINIGFPRSKGKRGGSHAIGQCFYGFSSQAGEKALLTLHPSLLHKDTPVTRLLDVLLHEAIHAALGPGKAHGAAFRAKMREVGLEGKATETVASAQLNLRLNKMIETLGPLPTACVETDTPVERKQTTRMRKYECSCGQIIRAATDTLQAKCMKCEGEFSLA